MQLDVGFPLKGPHLTKLFLHEASFVLVRDEVRWIFLLHLDQQEQLDFLAEVQEKCPLERTLCHKKMTGCLQ